MTVATMECVMTTSQSVLWVRWLGWTVVFGLVIGACRLAYSWLALGIPPALSLAFLGLPLVAAFCMGVGFPFWRWAAGPPVALFPVAPLVPGSMFQGMSYVEAITIVGFLLVFLMTITLVLYTLAARGVWWGLRREAATAGSTGSSLGGDAST
jgi:hypothetical protein